MLDDSLDIPDFLQVANRVPLTPELEARAKTRRVEETQADRWKAREEARKQERRDRAREAAAATRDRKALEAQIEKHRKRHPDPVEARLIRLGMLKPREERRKVKP